MEREYLMEYFDEATMSADTISARLNALSLAGWRLIIVAGDRHYFERVK